MGANENGEKHIFLSYAREDLDVVEPFLGNLETGGYPVWIDHQRIRTGRKWRDELATAIEAAVCVIVLISKDSLASEYVAKEVEWARHKKIPVLAVFRGTVELKGGLGFEIAGAHRETILDPATCAIPPNLILALAENHGLHPRAYHRLRGS